MVMSATAEVVTLGASHPPHAVRAAGADLPSTDGRPFLHMVIESADGTRIALDRSGSGPPLVIVLGAFCDRSTSKPLAALLASSYTVYEYDRRGRGDSGNGLPLCYRG